MLDKLSSQAFYDVGKLGALKGRAKNDLNENTIKEVARSFESLFVRMMLKSMRDASLGDPIFGGNASDTYRDMFDQQLSLSLSAQGGFGLSDMLEKFMLRQAESGAREKNADSAESDRVKSEYSKKEQEKNGADAIERGDDSEVTKSKDALNLVSTQKKIDKYIGIYR